MNDSKPSPVRGKKQESLKKFSSDFFAVQKPKSKSRVSSPEVPKKSSYVSVKSPVSGVNSVSPSQGHNSKDLEPRYRDLLAKYLAQGSRQNSPQETRHYRSSKPDKKLGHRKAFSNAGSPVVRNSQFPDKNIEELDVNCISQEQTLKKERTGAAEKKTVHSTSSKYLNLNKELENASKEQEEKCKKEKIMQSIVLSVKNGNIIPTNSSFYLIGKQLGKGAFGKVYSGLHRLTGLKVAIKAIDRSIMQDERTRRKVFQEVYIMKKIVHPNVLRLLEVFETSKHLMIVLEYCGGGDLLQLVKSRGSLTETEAKHIFSQVIDSIKACHLKNVIHRDVKLDNLLITTDFNCIKLCDFGVSRSVKPGEKIFDQCGTPAYLAPEIIADRGYDPFYVDIWSMGVLLFAILSGTVPFKAKNLPDLHKIILRCKYDMPEFFSKEAQDLVRRMLNPIPCMRISLDEMKIHPWFDDSCLGTYVDDSIAPRFLGGFESSYRKISEKDILMVMNQYGFPIDFVYQSVKMSEINHATATYILLEISSGI